MNARTKVAALRKLMKKHGVDAYYVPSADPHQSEYLPESWKHRAWLTGFSGSMGEVLIGARKAGLWTDGRYWLQGSMQLPGSGIDLMKMGEPGVPDMPAWVVKQLKKGQSLGMDPAIVSVAAAGSFEQALAPYGIKVKFITPNLVGRLWEDRPGPCLAPMVEHPVKYAGENVASKLKRLREAMKEAGVKAHVVSALDQIAWLFNVRSQDIMYTPVVTAYAVITDRSATLYVDPRKVGKGVAKALKGKAVIKGYEDVWDDLKALGRKKLSVLIEPGATNRRVQDVLKGSHLRCGVSPVTFMKAVKNPKQIEGITAAHVTDGVAMVKFLKWLEKAVPKGGVSEISASDRLAAFRAEGKDFKDLSFDTISGYAANGAIIHYTADEQSNAKLKPQGIYLIDSGGQYPTGTTDITRTVALGKPTRRMTECFTRVLIGTIDCTTIPFPAGTTGQRNEMFARRALWQIGEDYAHGTGHGVGQYLGVHEGPHSLKNIPTPPLVEGNLLSIEPGHYEAGKFGIRIEHLAFVVKHPKFSTAQKTWYTFQAVTMCPIDRKLIDKKLMSREQIDWLNAYHQRVYKVLAPRLDKEHKIWLKKATRAI
ncbi:MAG: aminopeptidase P family protein [Gemmatimonadales bacterium]|nr:aminopeptidase P family protein [Gemmatimonadales bacterium]